MNREKECLLFLEAFEVIVEAVRDELLDATESFGRFASYHEGIAIIREEFDELWDEIKGGQNPVQLFIEAKQLAAMAIRFIMDLRLEEHVNEADVWQTTGKSKRAD